MSLWWFSLEIQNIHVILLLTVDESCLFIKIPFHSIAHVKSTKLSMYSCLWISFNKQLHKHTYAKNFSWSQSIWILNKFSLYKTIHLILLLKKREAKQTKIGKNSIFFAAMRQLLHDFIHCYSYNHRHMLMHWTQRHTMNTRVALCSAHIILVPVWM